MLRVLDPDVAAGVLWLELLLISLGVAGSTTWFLMVMIHSCWSSSTAEARFTVLRQHVLSEARIIPAFPAPAIPPAPGMPSPPGRPNK